MTDSSHAYPTFEEMMAVVNRKGRSQRSNIVLLPDREGARREVEAAIARLERLRRMVNEV